MKPNSKLPLSPKNCFGNLKIEKLKNKKMAIGINTVIKNSSMFFSETKKYIIANEEIVVQLNKPSIPSK
jgi:hypothetical protein